MTLWSTVKFLARGIVDVLDEVRHERRRDKMRADLVRGIKARRAERAQANDVLLPPPPKK